MTKPTPPNARVCRKCHKIKPVYEFITGRNVNMQVTYSLLCQSCRIIREKEAKKIKQTGKIIKNKSDS